MGLFDWLFSPGEEQTDRQTTSENISQSFDPRMQGYFYDTANKLQNAFKNSTPNRNMQRAWAGIAGLRDPREYALASRAMQQATFGPDSYKPYMSPYQQEVTDRAIRALNEQSNASTALGALQSAASGGGAGTSADAIMRATMARNLMKNVGDVQAQGSQNAFELANQLAFRNAGLNLQRGQGLQQLAGARQTSNLDRLRALYGAGLAQYDLPRSDALRYAQGMAQVPYTRSQSTTGETKNYQQTASPFMQAVGLLGSAASAYMGMPGQFGGSSLGNAFGNATNWWTGSGGGGGGGGFMSGQNQGFW